MYDPFYGIDNSSCPMTSHQGAPTLLTIDVHAHFTKAPPELFEWRGLQITSLNKPTKRALRISDEALRRSLEGNVQQMDDRGIDYLMLSPRASGMGHDFGSPKISRYWTEVSNDLLARASEMFPDRLLPVCQLPQSPGVPPGEWLGELERAVTELGAVGCIINPDISGGLEPFTPALSTSWWDPLWEAMADLDLPGMIHASSTRNPAFHVNGAHYIAQHYAATVELLASNPFERHPGLKLILPHAGGGLPFQFNRHRALHALQSRPPLEEILPNLYFDTAIYDPASIELLIRTVGADNLLFASEMFGTADVVNPATGRKYDDTLPDFRSIDWLSEEDLEKILGGNARRLFSRAERLQGSADG